MDHTYISTLPLPFPFLSLSSPKNCSLIHIAYYAQEDLITYCESARAEVRKAHQNTDLWSSSASLHHDQDLHKNLHYRMAIITEARLIHFYRNDEG